LALFSNGRFSIYNLKMPDIRIIHLERLPIDDLHPMLEESRAQGFEFLDRLVDEHDRGSNRFDKPGEGLFGVYIGGEMIAIGGLNHDPYLGESDVARVRHVYVRSAWRRKGVGKRLVQHIVASAREHFRLLTLRTMTGEADQFYRAIGFQTGPAVENATHHLVLEES
jgi:GNAT superfamily N-acetyltransferase